MVISIKSRVSRKSIVYNLFLNSLRITMRIASDQRNLTGYSHRPQVILPIFKKLKNSNNPIYLVFFSIYADNKINCELIYIIVFNV